MTAVGLAPEHQQVLERMVRSYPTTAPAGWLRIVVREECSADPQVAGNASVQAVVVRGPDGLAQHEYRPPDDLYFPAGDMLRELAAASPTLTVVLELVVDATGRHAARVVQGEPRLLAGIRDETSSVPVHRYLERHRAELEALAARVR